MRKLIVSNLTTLDGYYEGKGRDLGALFEYFHDDYDGVPPIPFCSVVDHPF